MTIEDACQERVAPRSVCLRLWCALMRVVADAGYAPGVCACAWGFLFGASCVFMCRHLLTFARAWRFVLQWLVSHTPVCSFAIIFEKKNRKEEE